MENLNKWSIIGGFIALGIAILTYYKTFHSKPKAELENLRIHFKAAQSSSIKLRSKLQTYVDLNNAGNRLLMEGITFHQYIKSLDNSLTNNLSDSKFENIASDLTKPMIDSLTKDIEQQLKVLEELNFKADLLE